VAGVLAGGAWTALREYLSDEGDGPAGQDQAGEGDSVRSLFQGLRLAEGSEPRLLPVTLLRWAGAGQGDGERVVIRRYGGVYSVFMKVPARILHVST
jgi:hypothetical protein